jgi:hypothetical protein
MADAPTRDWGWRVIDVALRLLVWRMLKRLCSSWQSGRYIKGASTMRVPRKKCAVVGCFGAFRSI